MLLPFLVFINSDEVDCFDKWNTKKHDEPCQPEVIRALFFDPLRRVYAQYMNDTYIFPKIYEDMQLIVFLAYVSDIRVVSRQFVILER